MIISVSLVVNMKDVYVIQNDMTKEQMFRLRLMDGFSFAPITADAVLELSKDFFRNDRSGVRDGQMLYRAVMIPVPECDRFSIVSVRIVVFATAGCLIYLATYFAILFLFVILASFGRYT